MASKKSAIAKQQSARVHHCDIAVIGAGPAGLSLACALKDSGLRVALIDMQSEQQLAEPAMDGRDIAMTHHSQTLLRDAVIGSLVPLASAADVTNHDVPVTKSMITLASAVLDADIASAGRRLETIGISANDIDDARRIMDRAITSTLSTVPV